MRKILLLLPLSLLVAAPAAAQHDPTLRVSPRAVDFGESLTATGRHWPVFENCSRNVRFSLRSTQNAFHIGNATVSRRGRFSFTYKVKRSVVGAGRWRLRANMKCESGDDGSPSPIRISVPVTIG